MKKWRVGDKAELLDKEMVWNIVVILSISSKDRAKVNFLGWPASFDEVHPLSNLKECIGRAICRKCWYPEMNTPAIAFLRSGENYAGELYLRTEFKICIQVSKKDFLFVSTSDIISWDEDTMKDSKNLFLEQTMDQSTSLEFVDGTLPLNLNHGFTEQDDEEELSIDSVQSDSPVLAASSFVSPARRNSRNVPRQRFAADSSSSSSSSSSSEEEEVEKAKKVPEKTKSSTPVPVARSRSANKVRPKAKNESKGEVKTKVQVKSDLETGKNPVVSSTLKRRTRSDSSPSKAIKQVKVTQNQDSSFGHSAVTARYQRFEESLKKEGNIKVEDNAESKLKFLQRRVQLFCEDDIVNEEDDDDEEVDYIRKQPSCIENGEMRPYQIEGLQWLVSQYDRGIPMILADEMGLGKTLSCISLLAYLRFERSNSSQFPSLIVVPLAVLDNWMREFAKWCPRMKVCRVHDKESRENLVRMKNNFDVFVTTFEVIKVDKSNFKRVMPFHFLVMDEAHKVKNSESLLSKVCREMDSQYRLLLTGTPLQNNFGELWSLLNFLIPKLFPDSSLFEFDTVSVEELKTDQTRELLRSILMPFLLRRLKTDTTKEIPPKREIKLFCGMSEMQLYWYKQIITRNFDMISQLNPQARGLQNVLMQLRKATNHPYLFEGAELGPPFVDGQHLIDNSGKMILLDKLLKRLRETGDRVLIFSQMTRMLDLLEDYMNLREYSYCRLDGSTKVGERFALLDEFNRKDSKKFCFLLSTRAGGLGINLQTANVVILFDSDWNPFVDLQAQDRAHRIGQTKEVRVFRFITENTVEEKIVERAEHKLFLDAVVVQQHNKASVISKEELNETVCFGAEAVFRSSSSITDQDIDTILATGEERTNSERMKHDTRLTLGSFQGSSSSNNNKMEKEQWKQLLKPLVEKPPALGKRRSKARELMEVMKDISSSSSSSSSTESEEEKASTRPRSNSPLPDGWKMGKKDGKLFYFNAFTRESCWSRKDIRDSNLPAPLELSDEVEMLPPDWKVAMDRSSNRKYYYNVKTFESRWDCPPPSSSQVDIRRSFPKVRVEDTSSSQVVSSSIPESKMMPSTSSTVVEKSTLPDAVQLSVEKPAVVDLTFDDDDE